MEQPIPNAKIELSRQEAVVFLTAAAGAAVLYTICFSGTRVLPQISFTLFCPVAFALLAGVLEHLRLLKNKRALIWALPITALSAFNGIFALNLFTYGNVVVMHILFAAFILSATRQTDLYSAAGLTMIAGVIAGNWLVFISTIRRLRRSQGVDLSVLKKIMLGVLAAIPFLIIITGLLISADMVFGKLAENLVNSLFGFELSYFSYAISFVIAWIYMTGYVYQSERINRPADFKPIPADKIICNTFLTLVNAVFLLFTVIQIAYLFGGGFMRLPEGMVYSQYAREGFFQLLFVTVINFSVIIAFICALKDTGNKLLLLLCFFTGVLIASSFYRMALYIGAYGYTVLRLWVITFLAMEVFLLCIAVKSLFSDMAFIKMSLLTGLVFYIIVNVTGSEYFAMQLNVNRLLSGQTDYVDMRGIGLDGQRVTAPLIKSGEYSIYNGSLKKAPPSFDGAELPVDRGLELSREHWQNWSYLKDVSPSSY